MTERLPGIARAALGSIPSSENEEERTGRRTGPLYTHCAYSRRESGKEQSKAKSMKTEECGCHVGWVVGQVSWKREHLNRNMKSELNSFQKELSRGKNCNQSPVMEMYLGAEKPRKKKERMSSWSLEKHS